MSSPKHTERKSGWRTVAAAKQPAAAPAGTVAVSETRRGEATAPQPAKAAQPETRTLPTHDEWSALSKAEQECRSAAPSATQPAKAAQDMSAAQAVAANFRDALAELERVKEINSELLVALKVALGYVQKQYDNSKYTVSVYGPHLEQIKAAAEQEAAS